MRRVPCTDGLCVKPFHGVMVPAYYNEFDPYAAQWLRNLIAAGHIAPGDVDERSILEVTADDLRGYEQCHFFAGIGGWSYALRLAGWPDDRPVWTGSCPCQPFSAAGKQRGSEDERHLWPAFFRLISERRPARVYGEQVAGAAGLAWLDHVCADLEDAGYAAAAADLCAAGAGAPHIRQRLYWVADAMRGGTEHGPGEGVGAEAAADGCDGGVSRQRLRPWVEGAACGVSDAETRGPGIDGSAPRAPGHTAQRDPTFGLGDTGGAGLEGHRPDQGQGGRIGAAGSATEASAFDFWSCIEWIECRDGKTRPTQPGLFPLAHGIPNRVGRLRAYGNAIVPQVAAAFVTASLTHNNQGNGPRQAQLAEGPR